MVKIHQKKKNHYQQDGENLAKKISVAKSLQF